MEIRCSPAIARLRPAGNGFRIVRMAGKRVEVGQRWLSIDGDTLSDEELAALERDLDSGKILIKEETDGEETDGEDDGETAEETSEDNGEARPAPAVSESILLALKTAGLDSAQAILDASDEALDAVKGVGPRTAADLRAWATEQMKPERVQPPE